MSTRRPSRPKRSRDERSGNSLLARLPEADYRRLQRHLSIVPLRARQVLHARGESFGEVYFPVGGVCSIVATMQDGRMAEVAAVGREGMLGIAAMFGARVSHNSVIVQVPGAYAYAMTVSAFTEEMARGGALSRIVTRYAQALLLDVMRSVACNGLHTADQRCARWLLQSHDRVGRDEFALTQHFLAIMLGVRRATVAVNVRDLQHAGLIAISRRTVTILDRRGLEAVACECYAAIRAQFTEILG